MAHDHSKMAPKDKPFKKAKKMAAYDVVQRRGDLDCFCVGALHFDDDTVRTLMNCKNFMDPATPEEAIAISRACCYGGLIIPEKVYEMAGEVDFIPKWVFSSMPFTENKKHCVSHAKARDGKFKKAFDHTGAKSLGGISDSYDVTLNQSDAAKSYPSFGTRIEVSDTVPDFHEQNKMIKEQQELLDVYKEFLEVVMNEVHNMRLASEKIVAEGKYKLLTPELSSDYSAILMECWKGNMDGLWFVSDSDLEYKSEEDEALGEDKLDSDSDAIAKVIMSKVGHLLQVGQ